MPSGRISKYYYCFFRVPQPDGSSKQVKKCTKKESKPEALEAARLLEKAALGEARAGDDVSKALLGKVKEASELAMKGSLTPFKGRQLVSDMMTIAGVGELKIYTVQEWVTEWISMKERTVSKATLSFYRTVTKRFLKFLSEKSEKPLESIATAQIRSFRDSIAEINTAKTANHYAVALKALFGDAVAEHLLLQNPTTPLKSLAEDDSTSRAPFEPEEVAAILTACPSPAWEGMVLLGAYAGLRIRDAANLTSSNVLPDRLKLTPSKTKGKTKAKSKSVEIPIHPELTTYLKSHPPSPFPGTPLFPELAGKPTGGRDGVSTQFGSIMKGAGVSNVVTIDGEQKKRSYHSLRHSFVSWMSNADVSPELRKKLSGHSTDSSHQIYTSLELETLAGAIKKLPKISA